MNTKNIKLIVSDFDGTLVDENIITTPKVSNAVKDWISMGNKFAIATGRQYLMIKKECEKLGLKNPIIVRGGAEIIDPQTGEILFYAYMKKDSVERLIKSLLHHDFKLSIEEGATYYTDFYNDPRFDGILTFKPVEDFSPRDIPKIIALSPTGNDLRDVMHEIIKDFPDLHIVQIKLRNGIGWDITSLAATKHLAVLELVKMLNFSKEEVAGIGDGYNDFPLLEACGLKVAMGNAVEELKLIADLTVPSQKDDGVAVLIERLMGNEE